MNFTRGAYEADKIRYQQELDDLIAQGFRDDDFRVKQARRRLEIVHRVLTDPRYAGLIEEP